MWNVRKQLVVCRVSPLLCLAVFLSLTFSSCDRPGRRPKMKLVIIGGGSLTGVYYPVGGAICRMLNAKYSRYKIKATVEPSFNASENNLNGVIDGHLHFGITQADDHYKAYQGLGDWQNKIKRRNLRSVFSLHPEMVTVLASGKSGIQILRDLKGKRVRVGNPETGIIDSARDVLQAINLDQSEITAVEGHSIRGPEFLEKKMIDAYFFPVGHPNDNTREGVEQRNEARIIAVDGPGIERLLEEKPYYTKATIPIKDYPKALNDQDVPTIAVRATLVTNLNVDEDIVYALTKEVFDNFDEFKAAHPTLGVLTKEDMLKGLTAPLHPGALRYYMEAGLVRHIDEKLIRQ